MDNNWSKVYETSLIHKAEIVKSILLEKGIESVILNGQSSTHLSLNLDNDVQVFVKNINVIRVKYIITKYDL